MSSIVRVLQSAYNYCFNATPAPKENLGEAFATQRVLVSFLGTKEFGHIGAMLPYEKIKTIAKCFAIIDCRRQELIPLVLRHPAYFIINAFDSLAHDERSQRTYLINRIQEICATTNRRVSAALVANPYIANALRRIPLAELVYINRTSFIIAAARNGHFEVVRELLKNGAIPGHERGWAVREAASNGHFEVVRVLLERGAVIPREHLELAVVAAAHHGHLEVVRVLLERDAVISQNSFEEAVRVAALNNNVAVVQELLKRGAGLSKEHRRYAIQAAARSGYSEVVRVVLTDGAISRAIREKSLSRAYFKGHYDVVRELLKDAPTSTRLSYLPFLAVFSCCGARRKG